jgi:hypothetical protein
MRKGDVKPLIQPLVGGLKNFRIASNGKENQERRERGDVEGRS